MTQLLSRHHRQGQVGVIVHQNHEPAVQPPTMEPTSECPKALPNQARKMQQGKMGATPDLVHPNNPIVEISSLDCVVAMTIEMTTRQRLTLTMTLERILEVISVNRQGHRTREVVRKDRHFSANLALNVSLNL